MNQELFPEIKAAIEALQSRIAITKFEVTQLKEQVTSKKQMIRSWRKGLVAFAPQTTTKKKRADTVAKNSQA